MSDATPNLEQLLQMGIRTAREGNRQGAKMMFERVLATNSNDERAWLWLASMAKDEDDTEGAKRYLETVLKINPNNEVAQKALAAMEGTRARSEGRTLRFGLAVVATLVILVILAVLIVIALSHN
ncbi:MAG: tetratricopeptide repeat protein [Aggregatilineales bacterium]